MSASADSKPMTFMRIKCVIGYNLGYEPESNQFNELYKKAMCSTLERLAGERLEPDAKRPNISSEPSRCIFQANCSVRATCFVSVPVPQDMTSQRVGEYMYPLQFQTMCGCSGCFSACKPRNELDVVYLGVRPGNKLEPTVVCVLFSDAEEADRCEKMDQVSSLFEDDPYYEPDVPSQQNLTETFYNGVKVPNCPLEVSAIRMGYFDQVCENSEIDPERASQHGLFC